MPGPRTRIRRRGAAAAGGLRRRLCRTRPAGLGRPCARGRNGTRTVTGRAFLCLIACIMLCASALAAPDERGFAGWSVEILEQAKTRMAVLGSDLVQAPEEARGLAANARAAMMSGN